MKLIAVTGSHSNVGKTTLAEHLCKLLSDSIHIKIGHGDPVPSRNNIYYQHNTVAQTIIENHKEHAYLIIESNSILTEITPDLVIYLHGGDEKPSAEHARKMAHIVSGSLIGKDQILVLAKQIGVATAVMQRIIWLSGARPEPVTLVLLAGGKSSRMGKDKAFLKVQGRTLIEHQHKILRPLFDQVIVSVSDQSNGFSFDCVTVQDQVAGKGPLMGIYSALKASQNRVSFVVACDIPHIHPFITRELLSWSVSHDIVVPSFQPGFFEPLLAVYTKAVIPYARQLLDADKRKISGLFSHCKIHKLDCSDSDWYFNLNTPEEVVKFETKTQSSF